MKESVDPRSMAARGGEVENKSGDEREGKGKTRERVA